MEPCDSKQCVIVIDVLFLDLKMFSSFGSGLFVSLGFITCSSQLLHDASPTICVPLLGLNS
jgi:hypothetical protein